MEVEVMVKTPSAGLTTMEVMVVGFVVVLVVLLRRLAEEVAVEVVVEVVAMLLVETLVYKGRHMELVVAEVVVPSTLLRSHKGLGVVKVRLVS